MSRRIADILQRRSPVQLPRTASIHEAAKEMCAHRIGSILVTEGNRLEGIFTRSDLVCRVVAEGRDPATTELGEVMTSQPDTITPRNMVIDGLHMMHDGGYRHLPVIEGGRVVGVISRQSFAGMDKTRLEEETRIWERL